jgi:putative FmdB family regulatory protein
MAYYEYECTKCEHKFTVKQSFEEHDHHKQVKCPNCSSNKVEQLLTSAYALTSKKS